MSKQRVAALQVTDLGFTATVIVIPGEKVTMLVAALDGVLFVSSAARACAAPSNSSCAYAVRTLLARETRRQQPAGVRRACHAVRAPGKC